MVGTTHECDYPPEAAHLPRLTSSALPPSLSPAETDRHVRASLHQGSSLYHLDAGLLDRLQPDLIVTQELCAVCAVSYDVVERAAKRLRSDPRIVSLEPSSLEEVFANILFLGELTGFAEGAATVVARLRERLTAIPPFPSPRPRVLVLEWTDPPMNAGHWSPGLVECAGGDPVLGNPGGNSRVLDWEEIRASDPDDVVVAPCGYDLLATRRAIEALEGIPMWRDLRAVRDDRVHAIDGNAYLNRPGPRLVDTVELIAQALRSSRTQATG